HDLYSSVPCAGAVSVPRTSSSMSATWRKTRMSSRQRMYLLEPLRCSILSNLKEPKGNEELEEPAAEADPSREGEAEREPLFIVRVRGMCDTDSGVVGAVGGE